MATKSENADIAVLQNEMKDVKATLLRIENKVDSLTIVQAEVTTLKLEIAELKKEVTDIKNSKQSQKWLTAMALVVSLLLNLFALFRVLGGK